MIDDTILAEPRRLCDADFGTFQELMLALPPLLRHLPHIWMTEEETVPIGILSLADETFSYTQCPMGKVRWLQHVRSSFGTTSDDRLQICWSEARYRDLHNIRRRFGAQRKNYVCHVIVGDGKDISLQSVRWKPAFCNDDLSITDMEFWSSAVYLYRTSRGTYRFYHSACESFTMGSLAHQDAEVV